MASALTPLSSDEEIALRRIAHGSSVALTLAARLQDLALIQRTNGGQRLTPLGQQRYDALPKAPLLTRQRSINAVTGYVEGLIEKAQARARARAMKVEPEVVFSHDMLPLAGQEKSADAGRAPASPPDEMLDGQHFLSRAQSTLAKISRKMQDDRQLQIRLCDSSRERIKLSRSLLQQTDRLRPQR